MNVTIIGKQLKQLQFNGLLVRVLFNIYFRKIEKVKIFSQG